MGSSSNYSLLLIVLLSLALILGPAAASAHHVFGEEDYSFSSIFNFGDSLSDTGNIYQKSCISHEATSSHVCFPPYGETFFHRPTGRFSDGRLILDFIAESLGVPFLQPYLQKQRISIEDFEMGLNFAVGGATALDESFFHQRGILISCANCSLMVQLDWFNKTLSSLCHTPSTTSTRCREILRSSLVLVGEIGGNDYNHPFLKRRSFEEIKSFVPLVVKKIASAIEILIDLGAKTLMVPGNLPIGCSAAYLKIYGNSDSSQYETHNGCLKWLNEFSKYHNQQLQLQLKRIQERYPHVNVIYADYYNSALRLYNAPKYFGLTNTLQACCGDGDPKNCDEISLTNLCDDPSKYVSWDGEHLTEAAYKLITRTLLQDAYTSQILHPIHKMPQLEMSSWI